MLTENEHTMLVSIGDIIRKERLNQKMSQAQLAFEIQTDGRHIRRIEKGEVNVSFITLYRVSIALGISFSQLVK